MDEFGYASQFPRVLRRFALFAIAFSIVSITTGIFVNYSYGITQLGPAAVWLWPVAAVGQLLVVLVLAELAGHMPLAGANYQWAARLVDTRFGYVVGSLGVLYGAVGLPGIALIGLAPLTATVFGLDPSDTRVVVFIAVLALVVAYLINIVRVQLAARVNNVAVFAEIVGTVVLSVVVFVAWVQGGSSAPDPHGFGFLSVASPAEAGTPLTDAIVGGALIGIFTLVGFEAAADMAEEAVDARRTVPRAMLLSVIVSGVLGMAALIGFTLAIPDLGQIQQSEVPLADIAGYWLGPTLTTVFLAIVVFSMFALVVVAAASNSRLIFAMARDGLLPGSRLLRRVNERTGTPVPALVASLVVCLVLLAFGTLEGDAFGVLVGATALVPYLVYLLTLGGYLARRKRLLALGEGGFRLGAWAMPVAGLALLWLVAVVASLTVPEAFRGADYVVLAALALAGIWYVAVLRRRLRDGTAGLGTGTPSEEKEPA
ncbi:APC family permease [Pseudonocardia endophytica]|uniref:Amino acid/polyamine/organocation transporter (APC superfamily) n=1 Tax=Pseudonocardia endophytica TaxID=401976 RepID=A0A4R1HKA9_PSEEN|nr:APC family permease [Pseudonocardia endophytica]TCK21363.1 amino acid/polyamine/organocation transporter (APC superfamily) [Pseudonocardia endophytica]